MIGLDVLTGANNRGPRCGIPSYHVWTLMDVDEEESWSDEDDGMDVDGDEAPTLKRAKTNAGAVVARGKREPKSNRQLAGMRDQAVSGVASLI